MENFKNSKLGWPQTRNKLLKFIEDYEKNQLKEFLSLIKPSEPNWLFKNTNNLSIVKFYNKYSFEKVALSSYKKRIKSFINRNNRKLTNNEAIELLKPWGVVNKINGFVYKYTNKLNNKIYIGITTETIRRTRTHIRRGNYEKNLSKNCIIMQLKNMVLIIF